MRAGDKAYQVLHQDIVQWRLPPGTVLAEVELSERLGVSRTPVREALSRLTAEGLATAKGGRGIIVSEVSPEVIRGLYELRETLETKAAALTAKRGDPEVFKHLETCFVLAKTQLSERPPANSTEQYYQLSGDLDTAIEDHCGNPFLANSLKNIRPLLARARRMAQEHPERLQATAAEHAAICSAIAHQNPQLAAAAITLHLHNSLQHILNHKD